MKIGILTLPLHTNYGGILQAYALQTVLERMGHEVSLITMNRLKDKGFLTRIRYYFSLIKRIVNRYCLPKRLSTDYGKNTRLFVRKWIKEDVYGNIYSIPSNKYDAIVVGSDQIWRGKYLHNRKDIKVENVYLDFAKTWDILRVAYACSFGNDTWEYTKEETEHCSELIRRFCSVSVREESGASLCGKYLGYAPFVVLDPTMLLDKNDYLKLINKNIQIKCGIMSYLLDEEGGKLDLVNKIKNHLGTDVYKSTLTREDIINRRLGIRQLPLENWLAGFRDCNLIITDSFHACAFSIIFNKPFVVVPSGERGNTRIISLLSRFNQMFRLVEDIKNFEIKDNILEKPHCIIDKERNHSINFLLNSFVKH